jgi:dsDNA-binding SOS-regulon protein
MPFDAEDAFTKIAESDALDGLLKQAQARTAMLTRQPESLADVEQLDKEAEVAQQAAASTADMLREEVASKQASRDEKLHIVAHMATVVSRLVD